MLTSRRNVDSTNGTSFLRRSGEDRCGAAGKESGIKSFYVASFLDGFMLPKR